MRLTGTRACIVGFVFFAIAKGWTQETPAPSAPTPPPVAAGESSPAQESWPGHNGEASLVPTRFLKNLAQDQRDIWTSPFHARIRDLNWIAPAIGFSAGLGAADSEISSRISGTSTIEKHSNTLSNGGVGALAAVGGGLYLYGKWKGDTHQQEAGILAGEAAINGFVVDEALKAISRRERPTDGIGEGRFGKGSALNSSFPSAHAAISWSIASVLAHEYPGPLTQILVYGVATGVSVTRVTAQKHFPSDVVVGSALGWLIGRQVYASHHDRQLSDNIGNFYRTRDTIEEHPAENISSPYVPIDSWVYPAFDRLIALGGVHSAIQGLRPWTRQECARLLEEAEEDGNAPSDNEIARLYTALAKEFAPELRADTDPYFSVDSVYARVTGISGQPLTDGYHFASTIVNDYGRPFQKGMNAVSGFSTSASAGAFGFYVRGELEHAPSGTAISQTAQNAIQLTDEKPVLRPDGTPFQPAFAPASFNQFRLLDSYAMLNIKGWQASFGKQSLWLGPTQDPFLQTNNAEPMYMFRVDHTSPQKLPSILGLLGPFRVELWVGRMVGHHYVSQQASGITASSVGTTLDQQPLVNGQKINFHPTPNFEFGVGKTGIFGGPDFPVTGGSIKHVLFSSSNAAGRGLDPGDRRSTFDFSYR
ncbi:MAG TPA: capsule assembly Wzi family protein, partial [Alphaproteobacteria bacterium]|nr:capsule assembly Wzi family protein [Alphaproteobacteria bacterium]